MTNDLGTTVRCGGRSRGVSRFRKRSPNAWAAGRSLWTRSIGLISRWQKIFHGCVLVVMSCPGVLLTAQCGRRVRERSLNNGTSERLANDARCSCPRWDRVCFVSILTNAVVSVFSIPRGYD